MGPMQGIKVVELGLLGRRPGVRRHPRRLGRRRGQDRAADGRSVPRHGCVVGAACSASAGNPPFELDNRGKRSIALDYATDAGRAVLLELIDRADVFVTNLRVDALARAGLDYDALAARNPRLVYASVTGLGLDGDEADRPAYDVGVFWSRAGIAAALTPDGASCRTSAAGWATT